MDTEQHRRAQFVADMSEYAWGYGLFEIETDIMAQHMLMVRLFESLSAVSVMAA